jgi:patatin-related protein
VKPKRPELTQERTDNSDPRPATLATQEIRLALSFTGGVSLAIWMGGVARELDLLVQASERRRAQDETADPKTPDDDRLRRLYRRLLDLVDSQVAVDVLAGTSAGGINAALLGLVNVRGLDLSKLRDIWLNAGDFGLLLRDPRQEAPPSLLKGDGQMLAALTRGIGHIIGDPAPGVKKPPKPRETDAFITTTLLSPETRVFSDDYGTQIADTDHHAQFHFDESSFGSPEVVAPLALAARSSASFPAAFEPSFIASGEQSGVPDPGHPDMSAYTKATRSHWAADGGLLVNRPIAPLLQSIFDREADRQVRRTLLFITPTSGSPDSGPEDEKSQPLGLAGALVKDLGAVLNQSIAADLSAIKDHNDRTVSAADTRLRLATLGGRLPAGESLSDLTTWADYRQRQGDRLIAPLMSELSRQLAEFGPSLPEAWATAPEADRDVQLRTVARDDATGTWQKPATAADALDVAASLGRPAFDSAKATMLRQLRLGYVVATTLDQRNGLARLGTKLHGALTVSARRGVRDLVTEHLTKAAAEKSPPPLDEVVRKLTAEYASAQGTAEQLREAWSSLGATASEAVTFLKGLTGPAGQAAAPAQAGPGIGRTSRLERRALAADELSRYLVFLERGDKVAQLLDLHVSVRSVLPLLLEVQQQVELLQVSADTRTLLAETLNTAERKLTGMQMHHFGAFYKTSWRANDWMWGRLDGCGWLVHLLLDPRRILTVMEDENVPVKSRATTFARKLSDALELTDQLDLQEELAFLDDETIALPRSLPALALTVAQVLQQHIVVEELPVVAAHLRVGEHESPTDNGTTWLAKYDTKWQKQEDMSRAVVADLLGSCPVASETLTREASPPTPLYLRTMAHTAAVATSAVTGLKDPPASLRPTFATARAVTQTAYVVTDKTDGQRGRMVLVGLGLLVVGVLAMLTNVVLLGLTGLVLFGAGAVLLALRLGPKTVGVVRLLLALAVLLLAAAPWLPWLDERVFPWLKNTAVPAIDDYPWVWPVLLFLLILPSLTWLSDLAKRLVRKLGDLAKRLRKKLSDLAGQPGKK